MKLQASSVVKVNLSKTDYSIVPADNVVPAESDPAGHHAAGSEENGDGDDSGMETEETETELIDPKLDAFNRLGASATMLDRLTRALDSLPQASLQALPQSNLGNFPPLVVRGAVKELVDYGAGWRKRCPVANKDDAAVAMDVVDTIHVDGFDPEQIWLQLDMVGASTFKRVKKLLRKAERALRLLPEDVEEALDDLLEDSRSQENVEQEQEDEDFDDQDDVQADSEEEFFQRLLAEGNGLDFQSNEEDTEGEDDTDDEDEDENEEEKEYKEVSHQKKRQKKPDEIEARALIEDEFMKLDEMEAFLQDAERADRREGDESEESGESEEVDDEAFEDQASEDDDDEQDADDDGQAEGTNAMYEDFFGPRRPKLSQKKRVKFVQIDQDDEDEEDQSDPQSLLKEATLLDGHDNDTHEEKSSHQKRMERLQAKIKRLEEEALTGEKPWWLQGEIDARGRPLNSALEVDLDFETTMKPPPPPTEEATASLEDVIRRRIVEGRFDDPLGKISSVDARNAHRQKGGNKETDGDQEPLLDSKPTTGLGELYEKEYLAAVTGSVEDRDQPVRELAAAQWSALSRGLDALSHGRFAPLHDSMLDQPPDAPLTKVDVPAILMEEAAPAFVSSASMRAPEETYSKAANSASVSEAELTKQDRKRRRAAKKRAAKKRAVRSEEARAVRVAATGQAFVPSRVLAQRKQDLQNLGKASSSGSRQQKLSEPLKYSKSSAVFAKIQASGVDTISKGTQREETLQAVRLKL